MTALAAPLALRLEDPDSERVRRSHDEKIRELQDAAGEDIAGRWIGTREIKVSGFYTPTAGCNSVRVRMTGPGGAGGTATGAASGVAAGAGGSSGVYLEIIINGTTPIVGGAVSIAAGAPTTVMINGLTYVAEPGTNGAGMTSTASTTATWPGNMIAGSSPAIVTTWTPGAPGLAITGATALAGSGASGPLGNGGVTLQGPVVGSSAGGFGAGGAGGVSTTVTTPGGAGSPGVVIIDEYA